MASRAAAVRNVALVGHGDSGKTTFLAVALPRCGATQRRGSIAEKNTVGDYEAEFNFVGRLRQPVVELVDRDPVLWVLEKPKRVLVVTYSGRKQLPGEWPQPIYVGAWRGRILAVWPAELFERYGPLLLTGER